MEPDAARHDQQFKAGLGNGAIRAVAVPVRTDVAVPQPEARLQTTDDLLRALIDHMTVANDEQRVAAWNQQELLHSMRAGRIGVAQQWAQSVNDRAVALLTQEPNLIEAFLQNVGPLLLVAGLFLYLGLFLPLSIVLWRRAVAPPGDGGRRMIKPPSRQPVVL